MQQVDVHRQWVACLVRGKHALDHTLHKLDGVLQKPGCQWNVQHCKLALMRCKHPRAQAVSCSPARACVTHSPCCVQASTSASACPVIGLTAPPEGSEEK